MTISTVRGRWTVGNPTRNWWFRSTTVIPISAKSLFTQRHRSQTTASSISDPESSSLINEPLSLHDALVPQDPHRRIRFVTPTRELNLKRDRWRIANERLGSLVEAPEAHLVPMYMVINLADVRRSCIDRFIGNSRPLVPKRYWAAVSFSVSAAASDHWSHGLVSVDSPHTRAQTKTGATLESPTYFTEREPLLRDPFLDPTWNIQTAPFFAYGPPLLDAQDQESMAKLFQDNERIEGKEGSELFTVLLRPMKSFFFPIYKLFFLVQQEEGFAVMDTTFQMSKANTGAHLDCFQLKGTEIVPGKPEYNDNGKQWWWSNSEAEKNTVCKFRFADPKAAMKQIYETTMRAMIRNPISAQTWESPDILPFNGVKGKSLVDVLEYCGSCMLQRGTPIAPAFFGQLPQARAQLSARPTRPSRVSPSNSKPSTSSSHSASRTSTPDSTLKRVRISTSRDRIRNRDKLARDQAAEQYRRQRLWGESGAKFGAPPLSLPTMNQNCKVPRDPKHYYQILDIELSPDLLDPKMEEDVNKKIKSKFYALSLMAHPDRSYAGGLGEEKIFEESSNAVTMTDLNVAYENIETLQRRREYAAR